MTPTEYMDEIVVPTVKEFRDNRRSRRHAYLACIAVFHIKDHLKKAGGTDVESTMRTTCRKSFEIVRAICNGTKHVETNATHQIQFAAGDDWDRPPAILGELVLGLSLLGDGDGGREIGTGNQRIDIYGAVKEVVFAFQQNYSSFLGNCNLSDC